jgi:hypothetical protein
MTITNKTMPGANAPLPQQQVAVQRNESIPCEIDPAVVARPLMMPDFIGIKPKDPNLEGHWVNYDVGEKHSSMRFEQMKAMGFRPAKPDEVQNVSPSYATADGKIINGDVIYMVIPKAVYQGALKWNWEKAQRRRGSANATNEARDMAKTMIAQAGGAKSQLNKISTFVPSASELGALVGTDKDVTK